MHIDFVEIANFRKLRSTRVGFANDKTVFVGANNSGKTSAMVALRYFLVERERASFTLNDFTISHWPTLVAMGKAWERSIADDPAKCQEPEHGVAKPQDLDPDTIALNDDPFGGLIKINEISAQRGFGQEADIVSDDDEVGGIPTRSGTRKLSDQLRRYYNRHLDPYENPDTKDIRALQAIEEAQKAFDLRLNEGFEDALKELEQLGYFRRIAANEKEIPSSCVVDVLVFTGHCACKDDREWVVRGRGNCPFAINLTSTPDGP
jgi:predicted ATP-dependent endonuclease of OLD family